MAGSIAGAGVAATSAASALLPLAAVGAVVVQMPAMKQENWVAGMGGAALGVGVLLAFGPAAPGVLGLVTAASGGMAAMAMPGGRFVRMLPAMRTVANFTMKGMRRARAGSARGYQATHTFIRKKISPRLMKDSPSADVDMVSTGSV